MSDIDKALTEMVAMAEGVIAAKSRHVDQAHWGYNNVEEFAYHARPTVIVALAKELARLREVERTARDYFATGAVAHAAALAYWEREPVPSEVHCAYVESREAHEKAQLALQAALALTPADGGE